MNRNSPFYELPSMDADAMRLVLAIENLIARRMATVGYDLQNRGREVNSTEAEVGRSRSKRGNGVDGTQ